MGITVSNPDINAGRSDFAAITANGEKRIVFALSGVRNVGEGLVAQMLQERDANGPYESFHDFARRAPEQALNKRAIESLIKAGAFDSFGHPRRGLLMVHESIIDAALVKRREEEKGVMSLFGEMEAASDSGWSSETQIPDLHFTKPDQLRNEKDMLGLYISDHPLRGARRGAGTQCDLTRTQLVQKLVCMLIVLRFSVCTTDEWDQFLGSEGTQYTTVILLVQSKTTLNYTTLSLSNV